jgi:hypothetical protein
MSDFSFPALGIFVLATKYTKHTKGNTETRDAIREHFVFLRKLFASVARGRRAELHSVVSRICNPQAVTDANDRSAGGSLPNAIRRYSRLQICATWVAAAPRWVFRGSSFYFAVTGVSVTGPSRPQSVSGQSAALNGR